MRERWIWTRFSFQNGFRTRKSLCTKNVLKWSHFWACELWEKIKEKNLKFSSIQMRRYSYADNNFYCISFAYVYIFLPPLSFNFNWTNAQKCGNETRAIRLIWSICLYFRLIDVVGTRLDIVNSFTSHEKQQFGREKNVLGLTKYDSIRKLWLMK